MKKKKKKKKEIDWPLAIMMLVRYLPTLLCTLAGFKTGGGGGVPVRWPGTLELKTATSHGNFKKGLLNLRFTVPNQRY